ncbi:MAG: DUF3828 domain-containing protein [Gammaproteobacteria bacterium]|nr:MAG: DUF3828 domain-containing protein [Gammaproteobacteria bacterium]
MRTGGDSDRYSSRGPGRTSWLTLSTMLIAIASLGASGSEAGPPLDHWRIGPGSVAPWAPPGTRVPAGDGFRGQVIQFAADAVSAPGPLACARARFEYVVTPAAGLFQGMLGTTAESTASALGIPALPLLTLRVSCDSGVFDYHLLTPGKALLGLDNIIWPLETCGDPSPEATVLAMLQVHLTHDMAFTPASVARKQAYLSDSLQAAIAAWFARPQSPDTVPRINGDPFTDSQEYPDRFVMGLSRTEGAGTIVPIALGDGSRTLVVEFVLQYADGQWRIDDLLHEGGATLRGLLEP